MYIHYSLAEYNGRFFGYWYRSAFSGNYRHLSECVWMVPSTVGDNEPNTLED